MEAKEKSWVCIQNGAREHYAIPRALLSSGRLGALFTEIWAGPMLRRLAVGPLRPMAGRYHPDFDKAESRNRKAEIVSWNWQTIWRELRAKAESRNRKADGALLQPSSPSGEESVHDRFVRDGKWFSEKVRDYLARCRADIRGKIIFSYDTTALELFQWAKEHGAICVLSQMDPGRVEMELVREEERRWPGWANQKAEILKAETLNWESGKQKPAIGSQRSAVSSQWPEAVEAYFQRREQEWALADRIIVNSRWAFDALVKQGVPAEKLAMIPLCYEWDRETTRQRNGVALHSGPLPRVERNGPVVSGQWSSGLGRQPLRVLFLGQVVLRKGIQYLVEAAKLLADEPLKFDVVGPIGISDAAVKSAPANVTFHGRANRLDASDWYQRADVFVLPTISDGFALTQLEAMAHGLPVIATPNCGEVVTDGVDGFIVPARDAVALAEVLRRYLAQPELLQVHRAAALKKSSQFTLERLARQLLDVEEELMRKAENLPC